MDQNFDERRGAVPDDASLGDLADLLVKRITTGLVVAAAIVGVAIWARPGPPRYQIVASGAQMIRIDTKTGAMIACDGRKCFNVHKPGGRIERTMTLSLPAQPAAQPPAPAALPAPQAAPPAK